MSRQVKRYISLVIVLVIASTAWTVTGYIWRDRSLRLLGLQGTDVLFAAARSQKIISITVAPEREIDNLEFRFRCLIERDMEDVPIDLQKVTSVEEVLNSARPVSDRLAYFSTMGAEEYALIHEVEPDNFPGHRLVIVDFGRIYASLFDAAYDNESITTFAFLINSTDHLVGYFEGYSEILVMRGLLGRILRRGDLLDMVRVEAGQSTTEYAPEPAAGQLPIQDLPPWGQITFEDTQTDQPHSVTLIVKEGMIGLDRILFLVETFADGNWYEEASGYFVIGTRRI